MGLRIVESIGITVKTSASADQVVLTQNARKRVSAHAGEKLIDLGLERAPLKHACGRTGIGHKII